MNTGPHTPRAGVTAGRPKATPDQRLAQRRMVGLLRINGLLDAGGLVLWRELDAGDWKASANEIADDLDTLGIPHIVTLTKPCLPPWSRSSKNPRRRYHKIRVMRDDLASVERWMPSIGKHIAELDEADAAGDVERPDVAVIALKRDPKSGRAWMEIDGEEILRSSQ